MIKSELINKISGKLTQIAEKDIAHSVNLILDCLSDALGKNKRIEVRGFGSFCLHYRPPRNAHNPKTGAKVLTQAKYSPHFKPGKDLRERVNESKDNTPIISDDREEDDNFF